MSKQEEKPTPYGKLLDGLVDALTEAAAENEETLRAELLAGGYKVDEVIKRGRAFLKTQAGRQRLARARERREKLLSLIGDLKRVPKSLSEQRDQVREWLNEQFGPTVPSGSVQAFYHKLESVEKEDLESLIQDTELLEILDQAEAISKGGGDK